MSPINDDRDAVTTRHGHHVSHRQDLTGQIDHVAHENHLRSRRDVGLKRGDDL